MRCDGDTAIDRGNLRFYVVELSADGREEGRDCVVPAKGGTQTWD